MAETSKLPAHPPDSALQSAARAVRKWGDEYRVPHEYRVFLEKCWPSGGGLLDVRRRVEGAVEMLLERGLLTYAHRVRYEWDGMQHKACETENQLGDHAPDSLYPWDHDDTDPGYAWEVRQWQPMADGATRRIRELARELSDVLLGIDAEVSRQLEPGTEDMSPPMTKKTIANKLGFPVRRNKKSQRHDYRPFDKAYGHALKREGKTKMYRVKLWEIGPAEAERLR